MKRISFFLAILLALCFGQGMAANSISIDGVAPLIGTDTIQAGSVLTFHIRYTNGENTNWNITNGFQIFSPDGAGWATPVAVPFNFHGANIGPFGIDTTGYLSKADFPTQYSLRSFDTRTTSAAANGVSPDVVAFGGVASDPTLGLKPGKDGRHFSILIQTNLADSNKTICIDSMMVWFPTLTWKWASLGGDTPTGGSAVPAWSGQRCIRLWNAPNLRPNITNCITTITASHCGVFTYDFNAVDPDQDPFTFNLVSGPGAINAATGVWTASGLAAGNYTVVVAAADAGGNGPTCTVNIVATNAAPVITCPAGPITITVGETKTQDVNATDDCDVLTFSLLGSDPEVSINPATGVVSYSPTAGPARIETQQVVVSDGQGGEDTCAVSWNVITGAPYKVVIDKLHDVIQGQYYDVNLTLTTADTSLGQGLGGFDLLIAYDNSALSFQKAFEGSIYAECGWEYFTYRFGADGNCSGGCPSGLVRVVGIAETNNGAWHPACDVSVLPTTLATLRFLVSNNRTFECMYVPIRFFWVDCTDNTLSNESGSILYISQKVFDYDNANPINNPNFGLPTYLGAQLECETSTQKAEVVRGIDFQNGGIDIVCADSIDARGDINMNDLGYEIADAVMFTQYFIKGLAAFGSHVNGSIAASDVNADGIPLSVGDLVYLIRVVIGDAQPYDKTNVNTVVFANNNGTLSVDAEMGAASIVVAGTADAKLLANNMTMISEFDGTNTHILVYPAFESLNRFQSFSGDFLQVNGRVISAEFGTPSGAVAKVVELPKAYSLNQNYPNPFNPTTTISFALPTAGDYTLSVYNVAGQKVTEFAGSANAGIVEVEWNANGLASGVYFYKLEAGSFTATKKAVLLK